MSDDKPEQMVIMVFGLPGSGKSYFAERLSKQLKGLYVNSDELRIRMFSQRTYSDAEKMVVYDTMLAAMAEAIARKKPVVLDATFYKAALRDKFEQAAAEFKEKIIYIEVTAPESIIEERLKRPRIFSEANFDVYKQLKCAAEPLRVDHLVLVSSNDTIDSMLREAVRYIQAHT